jgi:predicted nuclease with TOPRIM domain
MINFFHRLFLANTEDDLRLESLKETNDRLEETADRLEETSSKLKKSVDRMIEKISNKNLKLQIKMY